MLPRQALTLQSQLFLPMIPLIIDTFARVLLLRDKLHWYEVPDLVTLLVTYAFFCLSLMFNVNVSGLPTDNEEEELRVELVRQKLLGNVILAVSMAGGVSFFRSFNEMLLPNLHIYRDFGQPLFWAVAIVVIVGFFQVKRKYLPHVHRAK